MHYKTTVSVLGDAGFMLKTIVFALRDAGSIQKAIVFTHAGFIIKVIVVAFEMHNPCRG